jgi:hypothetical protein
MEKVFSEWEHDTYLCLNSTDKTTTRMMGKSTWFYEYQWWTKHIWFKVNTDKTEESFIKWLEERMDKIKVRLE